MNQARGAIDPGVVVLSSSLQLLHINHHAISLLTDVGQGSSYPDANGNLTSPLHPHSHEILMAIRKRLASHNFTPFHCYRTIGEHTQEILLKGFGLPDRRGFFHSRIVMLLMPQSRRC